MTDFVAGVIAGFLCIALGFIVGVITFLMLHTEEPPEERCTRWHWEPMPDYPPPSWTSEGSRLRDH